MTPEDRATLEAKRRFVCGECGASVADPDGTLREGDLTLCEETRCDAEVREEASP
jgi:hypothetical protein